MDIRAKSSAVNQAEIYAHSIAMSERPVMTAQLIVAAASRRCALMTVTAAKKAPMAQKIILSGIINILTQDYQRS